MTDFTYEGFEPTQDIKSAAKQMLWNLESRAPSQAYPTAVLKRVNDQFLGNISFTSRDLTFSAEVQGDDPHDVLLKLKKQLRADIQHWIKNRY